MNVFTRPSAPKFTTPNLSVAVLNRQYPGMNDFPTISVIQDVGPLLAVVTDGALLEIVIQFTHLRGGPVCRRAGFTGHAVSNPQMTNQGARDIRPA